MRVAFVAIVLAGCTVTRPPRRIDYEGHRGARGLRPENTLLAFSRALELGVDTLELDVVLTADDVLVVHHDRRLDPATTRDAAGAWLAGEPAALRTLTLAELRGYDVGRIRPGTPYAARFPDQVGADGVRIPTLAEVVELAEARSRRRVRYNIEIKTSPEHADETPPPEVVAERLVAFVRSAGIAERTTVQSFDWRSLARVRALDPALRLSCLTEAASLRPAWNAGLDLATFGGSVPKLVHAFGCSVWSPDHESLSRGTIDEAHRLGLAVVPWTVNEPARMQLLIAWGVDGLITDYPDRLPRR